MGIDEIRLEYDLPGYSTSSVEPNFDDVNGFNPSRMEETQPDNLDGTISTLGMIRIGLNGVRESGLDVDVNHYLVSNSSHPVYKITLKGSETEKGLRLFLQNARTVMPNIIFPKKADELAQRILAEANREAK